MLARRHVPDQHTARPKEHATGTAGRAPPPVWARHYRYEGGSSKRRVCRACARCTSPAGKSGDRRPHPGKQMRGRPRRRGPAAAGAHGRGRPVLNSSTMIDAVVASESGNRWCRAGSTGEPSRVVDHRERHLVQQAADSPTAPRRPRRARIARHDRRRRPPRSRRCPPRPRAPRAAAARARTPVAPRRPTFQDRTGLEQPMDEDAGRRPPGAHPGGGGIALRRRPRAMSSRADRLTWVRSPAAEPIGRALARPAAFDSTAAAPIRFAPAAAAGRSATRTAVRTAPVQPIAAHSSNAVAARAKSCFSDSGSTSARLPRPGTRTPSFSDGRQIQAIAGARHRHIEQPPRFVLLAFAFHLVGLRHERPDRDRRLVHRLRRRRRESDAAGRWRPWPC